VRAATTDELSQEDDLFGLLLFAQRDATTAGEQPITVPDEPQVTLAVLRGARGDVRRQSVGSRSVRVLPRLHWDALTELYGSEEQLKLRVEEVLACDEIDDELRSLVEKYSSGWRPQEFGDE